MEESTKRAFNGGNLQANAAYAATRRNVTIEPNRIESQS
jgi:hypothetical protein